MNELHPSKLQAETKSAVILVGHGTRDEEGTRQFFELGELLSKQLDPLPVGACLLEFQRPTISEVWRELIDNGVSEICVAPLLLFAAGHAKEDIPGIIARCQGESAERIKSWAPPTVRYSRPISRHRAMIDLIVKRLEETASAFDHDPNRTALLMVGRGNRDACAQADMRVLSAVVARRFGFAGVHTAFYAMATPSLVEMLAVLAEDDRYDSIIIHPHLLFTGRLFEAIARQVAEAAESFPGIAFRMSDYLGPDPLVAQAIADRIKTVSAHA